MNFTTTDKMYNRKDDELILIEFVEKSGLDISAIKQSINRLNLCIAEGLQDYALRDQ
jgi:hypothetical protein